MPTSLNMLIFELVMKQPRIAVCVFCYYFCGLVNVLLILQQHLLILKTVVVVVVIILIACGTFSRAANTQDTESESLRNEPFLVRQVAQASS